MGADNFSVVSAGASADAAFRRAVEHAQWEHGHGGYSGTIAEKRSFTVIGDPPASFEPDDYTKEHGPRWWKGSSDADIRRRAYAEQLVEEGDPRVDDKWGPAGAIRLDDAPDGNGRWLFFGWASS